MLYRHFLTIKESLFKKKNVSKIWSSEQVLKHVQEHPSYFGGSADGPTPMEVDRIKKGRKGKNKGKNKGKLFFGGEWMNSWAVSRGHGRQNKGKGKGKSKGNQKGKKKNSKGNTKGEKGGRSKVAYGQCSNCYEYGHWAKDRPHMVNQVKLEPIAPNASPHQPAAKT